jgi:hypothetical protein
MSKQILSEEFRKMQKLANIQTEVRLKSDKSDKVLEVIEKLDEAIVEGLEAYNISGLTPEEVRICSLAWLNATLSTNRIEEDLAEDIYENETISGIVSRYIGDGEEEIED